MRILVPIAMLAALAACQGSRPTADRSDGEAAPSGEQGSRAFALNGFERVELRGPDNVEIVQGDDFSVTAEGDAEALADLEIEVVDGWLRIGREDGGFFSWGRDSQGVRVRVTMPAIRAASIAGSGDMTVDRAVADFFDGSVAGSGNLAIAALEARQASFDIAGSGNISAAGAAQAIEISIAGSGNVTAPDLRAETLEASIAGSGDVEGFATGTARASLLGSGDVIVRGGAQCSAESLGSGELRCEG